MGREEWGMGDWVVQGILPMEVYGVDGFFLLAVVFPWGYFCVLAYSVLCSFFITLQFHVTFECLAYMVWFTYTGYLFFVLLSPNCFCPVLKVAFLWAGISSWRVVYSLEASGIILCLYFQGLCCHSMLVRLYAAFYSEVIGNSFPAE